MADAPVSPDELRAAAEHAEVATTRRNIVLALAAAALMIGAAVLASWWLFGREGSETVPPENEVTTVEGVSFLIAVLDEDGRGVSTALIAADPNEGGTVVLVPPSLLATTPGFGDRLVGDLAQIGGGELAQLTLMNELGARIDTVAVYPPEVFAAVLGTEATVELDAPLVVPDGADERVLFGEGAATRSPEEIVSILSEQGTDDELVWLVRQGAAWEAIFDAAAEDASIVERMAEGATGDPQQARDALASVALDDTRRTLTLPVSRVESAGGDTELYDLPGGEADLFVETTVPYLAIGSTPRPRVEVLNGNGGIGTTPPVAATLIRAGYRVERTDNADRTDYDTTRVVAHGRELQVVALDVQAVLGIGEVFLEQRQPSGVVDVTIIVGRDIPAQEA